MENSFFFKFISFYCIIFILKYIKFAPLLEEYIMDNEKQKALEAALSKIEKDFGKGL